MAIDGDLDPVDADTPHATAGTLLLGDGHYHVLVSAARYHDNRRWYDAMGLYPVEAGPVPG